MTKGLKLPSGWKSHGGMFFTFTRGGEICAVVDRVKNPATGLIEWQSTGPAGDTFHGQDFHDALALASEVPS